MNTKLSSSLELMRFGRSVLSACLVLPLSWRFDHFLIFLCFLLFSFAWNDYVDRHMDTDGHPERPLPSGRIAPIEACLLSGMLFAVGLVICLTWATDLTKLFTYGCLVSALYSWVLKRHIPLIATPVCSLCMVCMMLYPTDVTVVVWIFLFIAHYIHEILLDMRDDTADAIHCTTPSITTLLGEHCKWFVLALTALGLVIFEMGYTPNIYIGLMSGHHREIMFVVIKHNFVMTGISVIFYWTLYRMIKHEWDEITTGIKFYKGLFPLCVLLV